MALAANQADPRLDTICPSTNIKNNAKLTFGYTTKNFSSLVCCSVFELSNEKSDAEKDDSVNSAENYKSSDKTHSLM